jgi:hypothetical protein
VISLLEAPLTELLMSGSARSVGRKQINHEQTPARFPEGTLARIDAVLTAREKRSDLIRQAVEREIERRQKAQKP